MQLPLHNHCSQVLSREWLCSWSSADRRWVINNFIAHCGAPYIRGFTFTFFLLKQWNEYSLLIMCNELSLTCRIVTLTGNLLIDTYHVCFYRYTFPLLGISEVCIIILSAHGQDLASVLTHSHPSIHPNTHTHTHPLHGKTQNVRGFSDIRLPIYAQLGEVVWNDSRSCHYHWDGFWVSWIVFHVSSIWCVPQVGYIKALG